MEIGLLTVKSTKFKRADGDGGGEKPCGVTSIFKTFGKTADELKEILSPVMKNKRRISFSFTNKLLECDVMIRFPSNISKETLNGIISKTAVLLSDCMYADADVTLAYQVGDILKAHNKTICVAESFTGGGIAHELVKIEGISSVFKEGIVSYSNESKIRRLNVEEQIISHFGAVSIETVYEMAASLLMNGNCDIAVATTGNAGPSAEKDKEVGLCFIAVGTKNGIHIYKHIFDGDRKTVIESGVKTALFHLYKKLTESEFEELLKIHAQSLNKDS